MRVSFDRENGFYEDVSVTLAQKTLQVAMATMKKDEKKMKEAVEDFVSTMGEAGILIGAVLILLAAIDDKTARAASMSEIGSGDAISLQLGRSAMLEGIAKAISKLKEEEVEPERVIQIIKSALDLCDKSSSE